MVIIGERKKFYQTGPNFYLDDRGIKKYFLFYSYACEWETYIFEKRSFVVGCVDGNMPSCKQVSLGYWMSTILLQRVQYDMGFAEEEIVLNWGTRMDSLSSPFRFGLVWFGFVAYQPI